MSDYFVIYQDDREVYVLKLSKRELEIQLNETPNPNGFVDDALLNDAREPCYWSGKQLIIKGTIVVPKPKISIKTWEV